MTTLVTGATGYFGNKLALSLAHAGHKVHILVRNIMSKNIPVHDRIQIFEGNIQDRQSVKTAMQGCDFVFHAAALVRLTSLVPSQFFEINVNGTKNMLDAALELGVKKFVFTSSCGVLGASLKVPITENDPRISSFNNDYELTKFLGEKMVKEYAAKGLFCMIANLSKVFGPGLETHTMSVNRQIKNFTKKRLAFIPYPGDYKSNYVYIDDAIAGHQLLLKAGLGGENYIIGGENLTFNEFYQQLNIVSGVRALKVPVPKIIAKIICVINSFLNYLRSSETDLTLKGVQHIYCDKAYSCTKAIRQLGYRITPFNVALKNTLQYLNS